MKQGKHNFQKNKKKTERNIAIQLTHCKRLPSKILFEWCV